VIEGNAVEHYEIPILLVEDSSQDVSIIKRLLKKNGIRNPLHLARDGEEAIALLLSLTIPFGVLILDIHLPKKNGIEVLKVSKELDSETVVIMLTGQVSIKTAVQSLRREGAFDYLEKSKDDHAQLIEAVRLAIKKRALSLQTHWTLQGDEGDRLVDMTRIEKDFQLSRRELDVVKCLCLGDTNREIAEKLFISELTIKVHLKKIYEKMKVHNRTALSSKVLSSAIVR